jgi:hypothetical protein
MLFRLVNAEYDSHTKRAYVEFRANDGGDGDEIRHDDLHLSLEIQVEQIRNQTGDCPQGTPCAKKGSISHLTSEAYRDP